MSSKSGEEQNKKDGRVSVYFTRISEKVGRLFFANQRKQMRKKTNALVEKSEAGKSFLSIVGEWSDFCFFLVAMLGLIFGFLALGSWFKNTGIYIQNSSLVQTLAEDNFVTKMYWGNLDESSKAEADWKHPEFIDVNWQQIKLPREYGFRKKLNPNSEKRENSFLYYRFYVNLNQALLDSGEAISFSPIYVKHRFYEVYVNGHLVSRHQSDLKSAEVLVVPILKEHLNPKDPSKVVVAVRASSAEDESGITGYAIPVVGPSRYLSAIYTMGERATLSYFLIFLMSKGAVLIVFILFYFFSLEKTSLRYFLIYALCVTVESLIQGEFLSAFISVKTRTFCFYWLKSIGFASLFAFFVSYYQALRALKWVHLFLGIYLSVVGFFIFDRMFAENPWLTWTQIFTGINHSFSGFLLVGVVLGIFAVDIWKRAGVPTIKLSSLKLFVGVSFVYFVLCVWEFGFNSFLGFDQRAFFDMIFFFYVAFVTAKEFGFNAGQVISLEAHMVEKKRMQAELEEAAEIARVFIPGEAPVWEGISMGIYHKAITESSGDWYNFEASKSGRFKHMIMCDVTGHGVQAAIIVSTAKTVLSALKETDSASTESAEFLRIYANSLNKILYQQGNGSHVSSLMGLSFDVEAGKLHYLCCAHPSPILLGAKDFGEIEKESARDVKALVSRTGVLGMKEEVEIDLRTVDLKVGDEVLAYTDGVPMLKNIRQLKNILRVGFSEKTHVDSAVLNEQARLLYDEIWKLEQDRDQDVIPHDDVSIVWFKWAA